MNKTVVEIYMLLICLGSIVCLVTNIGIGVYNVVRLINPSLTISDYQYVDHQNNDNFWRHQSGQSDAMRFNNIAPRSKQTNNSNTRPTEDKLTEQRLESYQNTLIAEKRSATRDLIFVFIIIVISATLFFIHWRMFTHKKQERIEKNNKETHN